MEDFMEWLSGHRWVIELVVFGLTGAFLLAWSLEAFVGGALVWVGYFCGIWSMWLRMDR